VKLARKHRTALAMATIILLLLVTGVAISTWQAVRATLAEGQAQAEAQKALAAQQAQTRRADGEQRAREQVQRERDAKESA
jgi:hypothetical protein